MLLDDKFLRYSPPQYKTVTSPFKITVKFLFTVNDDASIFQSNVQIGLRNKHKCCVCCANIVFKRLGIADIDGRYQVARTVAQMYRKSNRFGVEKYKY